ncbi:MAG: HAD-IA family hydrolase [Patescibacteria group bacterium]
MEKITTLIFDIDGTILDTQEFIFQATEYALATSGYSVPERSIIAKNVGKSFPEYYFSLTNSEKDIDKLIDTHRAFQYLNFNLAKLFPNALETLKTLKNKGYKLAVVTTRSKKTSHQNLIDSNIFNLFNIVISGDDVKKIKPDPEPLLMALEFMQELPEKAIMIGDSYLDIQAGKNAGTKTIRATYGFHIDKLHEPEPDFFISDISDLLKLL